MFRRSLAILAVAAVTALFAVPQASAQDAELDPYGAGASATALFLSILEEEIELTFSSTSAAVGSEPEAAADGQAAATPLFSTPGAPVSSTGALVEGEDCALAEDLPAPINLAGLDIACVRTAAEVADGSPAAGATSDEIVLEVIDSELVEQLSADLLGPLLEQILAPITSQLGTLGTSLETLVDLLLADLENGGTLATIEVAPTSSTASEVESLATAQGATIELLPGLLPGIGPIATVVVGDSFSSAAVDPATGEVTIDGQAAFLTVDLVGLELVLETLLGTVGDTLTEELGPLGEVLQPVLDAVLDLVLGLDDQVEELVNVTIDQLACPDSPLAAILCFEAGGVNELDAAGLEAYGFTYGEGTRGIESSILGLSVLDGLIELGIGQTAAGANGVLAVAPPVAPPTAPPAEQPPLPRTGMDGATPLALALFAAAAAGLAIVRRTRTV
jgi:hypothetical protein